MKLFYSYSQFDLDLLNMLETHLSILKRQKIISTWAYKNINAGQEWRKIVDKNLQESDIILLLISSYFIASDYCFEYEMQYALDQHKKGNKLVVSQASKVG